jgi:hypothetical protein
MYGQTFPELRILADLWPLALHRLQNKLGMSFVSLSEIVHALSQIQSIGLASDSFQVP